jgi:hypothetical protein
VHTGVVSLMFFPERRHIAVGHCVVLGPDAQAVKQYCPAKAIGFIEGYRPRHHMQHDSKMVKAVAEMRAATGFKVLDNTGVKKIVLPSVMEVLGVQKFSTPTHHDDLRSAARIALLGMYKDTDLNRLVATVIKAHLDQTDVWSVTHH